MATSGRRRHGLPSPSSIALIFLLFLTSSASAAVLGIDFGTLNIKAVLVKPGNPFDIVLTKDSKRKEASAVAFKAARDGNKILAEAGSFPERLYGPDALALQGRFPRDVFPNLKPILGLSDTPDDRLQLATYQSRYPAILFAGDVIKSSAFHESEASWTVEELLAMELTNIRRNAENMAGKGVSCESVVITIPAFYTAQEKSAIVRAADLAGLNVMTLITDGLAVGLDYAKSRTFPSISEGGKPEHHLVFDMGAGSTTATVLRFQGRSVKDVGRFNKTVQEVAVLGVAWDKTLGGDALTQVIMTDYIYKFSTKPVMKSRGIKIQEVQQNGRAMSRLWKEAEKTRSVLSANTETVSSFEELLPDIDFKTKLSRTEFEKLTEDYAERVEKPIYDALEAAGLEIADIDSVILFGGAVRTPFVQRKLEGIAGSAKLKSNVNADESAVFGAALRAAALSPSFKVKEIRHSDSAGYASGLSFLGEGGKQRSQIVFSTTSAVGNNGTTKQVSFKQKDDFVFQLYQKLGDVETPFAEVRTQNLSASVKALKDKFACDKDDVSTKFSLRLSPINGLIEASVGTVSCETDSVVKSSVGDSVKDWLGLGKKKDQAALTDEDEAESTEEVAAEESSTSTSATSTASQASEKPKKRTETINIDFTTALLREPKAEEIQRQRDRLVAFDLSDKVRLAREDATNALESYTYYVRDFLSNTEYSSFSTESQRDAVSKLLQSTREFMDQPSEVAKATEKVFREKLAGLKDLITPILARRTEGQSRPDKLSALKSSLEQTNTFMSSIADQVSKAKDAASSSLAKASESASSLADKVVPSAKDDLDDLEEPESSTADPEPSTVPEIISPYTDDDLDSIRKVYEDVTAWLTGKESEQSKLKLFDDPAFTIKDIEKQASLLSDAMIRLVQKKIKMPPRSSKKAKTSKTKAPKKSKTSNTESPSSSITEPADAQESILSKAKFLTVTDGDDMPSEDEILQMVKEAKNGDSSNLEHEEL